MNEKTVAVWPGAPSPLGATFDGDGVNFALASGHAHGVELCLFDAADGRETHRVPLPERTADVFHGYLPGLRPGQVYGFRVHGPFQPLRGHRFNAAKLLLDPYAKALSGSFVWDAAQLGYVEDDPEPDLSLDPRDDAPFVPKAVVTAPLPPLEGPRPARSWSETVIYEAHLKGLTKLHPELPADRRGRYLGLAEPRLIEHLVRLGVTAIELLPVAAFLDERRLVRRGLVNYWGYNPFAFFVPEARYALEDPVAEFRAMVQALHAAGLEVILDTVLNHTAESDELGPTLSFRGIDNAGYYRLRPGEPRRYVDHSGTGNTLDFARPRVIELAMAALRHWVQAFGVDGFRFDLGTVLGRDGESFDGGAAFLDCLRQDPVLQGVKLIAEPWDLGHGGYQLGRFPHPFVEWNDRFRDTVRRFWRGDEGMAPDLAARLLGSADLFEPTGRPAWTSLNYVTSHDGFTLRDLVSYAHKHNEANGEANHDGHDANYSANHGVEGDTTDPSIRALRARQQRNLLATLLLAQGTPMLLMGDEAGRSQRGNNNAYCQDNEISWYPWDRPPAEAESLLAVTRRLIALRRAHPVLRRRRFLHGRERDAAGARDATWLAADGREMTPDGWWEPRLGTLGLLLGGRAAPDRDREGRPLLDATLLLLLNAAPAPAAFTLPEAVAPAWRVLLDTARPEADEAEAPLAAGITIELEARSLRLLEAVEEPGAADGT
jgi:isoamylase